MRKLPSRCVSLRLGLGAVALSLGAVVVGPATAASASEPGQAIVCAYGTDAAVAFLAWGEYDDVTVSADRCETVLMPSYNGRGYDGPLWVYGNGLFLGATEYHFDQGMDIVVKFDPNGHLMFWA
jgi:hypothetical protein